MSTQSNPNHAILNYALEQAKASNGNGQQAAEPIETAPGTGAQPPITESGSDESAPTVATPDEKHRQVLRQSHPQSDEVSFVRATNGMIAELVWDPKRGLLFCIRNAAGKFERERKCDEYKPLHWLADYARDGDVHLASTMAPYDSLASLAAAVRAFIHRYAELDPLFESVATMFVLMTWLYDDFHALPYLRFLGPPESGKTRSSETIGALCYRTLMIAGAATPAPRYHRDRKSLLHCSRAPTHHQRRRLRTDRRRQSRHR